MPLTARSVDPLDDLRQIAEALDLDLAIDLWLRTRSRREEILTAASRRDLRADAREIDQLIESNPIFACKEGYRVKDQVLNLLASIRLTIPNGVERHPSRLIRRRQPA